MKQSIYRTQLEIISIDSEPCTSRHNIITSVEFRVFSLSRGALEIYTCRINMKFENISFKTHRLHIINCRNGVHARLGPFGTFHYIYTGR